MGEQIQTATRQQSCSEETRASRAKAIRGAVQPEVAPIAIRGKIVLTYDLIMAAGRDEGNRHAQAAGRSAWSRADYNAACRLADRLFREAGLAP